MRVVSSKRWDIRIKELECLEGGEDQLYADPELDTGGDGRGGEVREGTNLFLGGIVVDIYVYGDMFAYYIVDVSLNCRSGGV